jgi:hypothetical protein
MLTFNKRVILTIIVAGVSAVLSSAAGCGDDDSSGGNVSDTAAQAVAPDPGNISISSKAQFVKVANGICRSSERRIESGVAAFEKETGQTLEQLQNEDGIQRLHRAVFAPALQEEVRELRALEVPSGERSAIDAVMTAIERSIHASGGEAPSSTAEYAKRFSRARKLASSYGLTGCPVV